MLSSLFSKELIEYFAISLAFTLASSICVMIAIGIDAKQFNIKSRNLWISFSFFFGVIAGIVYIIKRKKLIAKANADVQVESVSTKPKTLVIVLMVVIVILNIFGRVVLKNYNLAEEISNNALNASFSSQGAFDHLSYHPANTDEFDYYYDMNKKPYIDNLEVPYYTENGNEYLYEYRADGEGLMNNATGEFHKSEECFVDENGYLVFDDTLYNGISDYDYSVEKDGKIYHMAGYVSWNNFGDLVDNHGRFIAK